MIKDDFVDEIKHNGFISCNVIRNSDVQKIYDVDFIAEETPVALVYNGISHVVMMTTPCDLKEFAAGFSITEGIVENITDIYNIEIITQTSNIIIEISIAQKSFQALKSKRRALLGRTGCGVCGIENLELLDLQAPPIRKPQTKLLVSSAIIKQSSQNLQQSQFLNAKTGGTHAAAWCDNSGNIIKTFEDVGRHNALDKLIGYLALNNTDFSNGFVFISSRGSYELVRKVARVNIQLLATISAPTSLAIEIAKKSQVSLVCFCRNDKFVEYL